MHIRLRWGSWSCKWHWFKQIFDYQHISARFESIQKLYFWAHQERVDLFILLKAKCVSLEITLWPFSAPWTPSCLTSIWWAWASFVTLLVKVHKIDFSSQTRPTSDIPVSSSPATIKLMLNHTSAFNLLSRWFSVWLHQQLYSLISAAWRWKIHRFNDHHLDWKICVNSCSGTRMGIRCRFCGRVLTELTVLFRLRWNVFEL